MPPPRSSPRSAVNRAFTLIELLTVIAIVAILVAILIPTIGHMRESARSALCVQNLKSIGTAFQLYAADNHGLYPALRWRADASDPDKAGDPRYNPTHKNWQVELTPYQSRAVATLGKLDSGADSYVFCPEFVARYKDDPRWKSTVSTCAGYGMNANIGIAGVYDLRFRRDLIVHPSRTILVGDSDDYHIDITSKFTPSASKLGGYGSGDPVRHGGGANYLFADGHVETLSPDAALDALVNRPPN